MNESPTLSRRLEAAVILPLARALQRLPPPRRVAWGRGFGRVVYALDRGHRELAFENLQRALELGEEPTRHLARESFAHFGRVGAECLALPVYRSPEAGRLFEVFGMEHLARAYAKGRGTIVFSAHFGNWELVALRQALAGFPMDFIARPLDNPILERALSGWREEAGNRVLGKRGVLFRAVRSLRQGRGLAILIDQNVRDPPRYWFRFLGRITSVTPALAHLALRTGATVIPVVSFPRPDGGYRIVYEPELEPIAGDFDEQALDLSRRATGRVEAWIRECPGAWLWFHDRWKSSPWRHEVVT